MRKRSSCLLHNLKHKSCYCNNHSRVFHCPAFIWNQNLQMINECVLQTDFSALNTGVFAASPCIASATMVFASDLELPGLPTKKSGMRNSMQITIMNTFSLRAWLRAMLGPRSTPSRNTSWHLQKHHLLLPPKFLLPPCQVGRQTLLTHSLLTPGQLRRAETFIQIECRHYHSKSL